MEDLIREFFEAYPVAGTVLAGLVAAHALAIFVVNLTPTPRDNAVVRRVYKAVEWLAGVVSKKAKEE